MSTIPGFKRILVAFDGSPDSKKAVKIACSLAKLFKANVTVLHVYSYPLFVYAGPTALPPLDYKSLEADAELTAQRVIAAGLSLAQEEGVKATGEILESGSVVEGIITFVTDWKADIIVIGTRGTTGFKRLLLGSVSSGVVTHASCPVLVAR